MPKASTRPLVPRILSRGEVSRIFGVSPSTITRWARQGRLPCMHTLGGHRRYLRDDIARLVEASRRPGRGPNGRART